MSSFTFTDSGQFGAREQAWAYLSRVVEGPNAHVLALIWEEGEPDPIRAAERIIRQDCGLDPRVLSATRSRHDWIQPLDDLRSAADCDARIVTPDSSEWPGEALAEAFSVSRQGDMNKSTQDDAIFPHCLWAKGDRLDVLVEQAVTIVGTRAATRYGRSVGKEIAADCAKSGWTVISGGALGIDIAAHEAAVAAGGRTLAVFANGLDCLYPAANAEFLETIPEHGALVSEYPPGVRPARHRFLTRNRLAAAFGRGVVVIEAAFRSGALNTVNWAEAMGKQIFAVPGMVTARSAQGCHRLIRDGRAELVESAADVLESLGPAGTEGAQTELELEFAASPIQQLDRTALRVYDATSRYGQPTAEIAESAGLPVAQTMTALCQLVALGLVARKGNDWQRCEVES